MSNQYLTSLPIYVPASLTQNMPQQLLHSRSRDRIQRKALTLHPHNPDASGQGYFEAVLGDET
jgi:hypothetical protein